MSPWLGLVLALVTGAAVFLFMQRGRDADALPEPREGDAPPPEATADGHTLQVTADSERLSPMPRPPQKPDVRPGMYTFGFIWRWDGAGWHLETPPDCEPITAIHGVGRALYAVGWNELWRRGPDGDWSRRRMPVRLQTLHGWSEDVFMCAGNRSVFLIRDGEPKDIGTLPEGIAALWGPSPDDVWVVGWSGMIMRWRDGAWTREDSGVDSRLTGVFGQGGEIVIVGEDEVALRSTGDGVWIRETVPARESYPHSLDALWGDGRGVFYAVTMGGAIMARRDGAWRIEAETGRQLLGVHGRGADDIFALGLQGQIWRSDGRGAWRDEGGARSNSLRAVFRHGDDLYVGGDWFFEVS